MEVKFLDFWVLGLKFTKSLMSNLKVKRQVRSLFNIIRETLLYFLSWNFIWFLQKEFIKVQNLRLLTVQVKFHQICTLIGSICFFWKYIKFQLKKYRRVMYVYIYIYIYTYYIYYIYILHIYIYIYYIYIYWRGMQTFKKNRFVLLIMTRIGEFWSEHSKV